MLPRQSPFPGLRVTWTCVYAARRKDMKIRGETAHIFNISIRCRFSLRRIYFVNRRLDPNSVDVVAKRNVSARPGNRTFMHPVASDLDPKFSCKQ